jgi:hypothetical protein
MHEVDLLPIAHPNGYRQILFQDHRNIYGKGHTALLYHTSPHKQYYYYIAPSIEHWLKEMTDKLKNQQFLLQKGHVSYFCNVRNMLKDPTFVTGSAKRDSGFDVKV